MVLGEKLKEGKRILYSSVQYNGEEYRVGGGCYLDPAAYTFKYKKPKRNVNADLPSKVRVECDQLLNRPNREIHQLNIYEECPEEQWTEQWTR